MSNKLQVLSNEHTNNTSSMYHKDCNTYIQKEFYDKIIELDPNIDFEDVLSKTKELIYVSYSEYPITDEGFNKIGTCGYGSVVKTDKDLNFKINETILYLSNKSKSLVEYTSFGRKNIFKIVHVNDCFKENDNDGLRKAFLNKEVEVAQDTTSNVEIEIKDVEEPIEIGNDIDSLLNINSIVGEMFKMDKQVLLSGLKNTYVRIKVKNKVYELTDDVEERKNLLSAFYFYDEKTSKSGYVKGVEISSNTYHIDPAKLRVVISARDNAKKTTKKLV